MFEHSDYLREAARLWSAGDHHTRNGRHAEARKARRDAIEVLEERSAIVLDMNRTNRTLTTTTDQRPAATPHAGHQGRTATTRRVEEHRDAVSGDEYAAMLAQAMNADSAQ